MKAGEVLRLLKISKPTFYRYRKEEIIRSHQLPSGFFEDNKNDDYTTLNKDVKGSVLSITRKMTSCEYKCYQNSL